MKYKTGRLTLSKGSLQSNKIRVSFKNNKILIVNYKTNAKLK